MNGLIYKFRYRAVGTLSWSRRSRHNLNFAIWWPFQNLSSRWRAFCWWLCCGTSIRCRQRNDMGWHQQIEEHIMWISTGIWELHNTVMGWWLIFLFLRLWPAGLWIARLPLRIGPYTTFVPIPVRLRRSSHSWLCPYTSRSCLVWRHLWNADEDVLYINVHWQVLRTVDSLICDDRSFSGRTITSEDDACVAVCTWKRFLPLRVLHCWRPYLARIYLGSDVDNSCGI